MEFRHAASCSYLLQLRGVPEPLHSEWLSLLRPQDLPPPLDTPQTITSTSVIIDWGTETPVIVKGIKQISLYDNQGKSVWLAEINRVRCVLKCWVPDLDEL